MHPHTRRASLAASAATALALTGCHLATLDTNPQRPGASGATLSGLRIAAETGMAAYDRDNWPHWTQDNGCDTRESVLQNQGEHVVTGEDCEVLSGVWVSRYDGQRVTDPSALDIDHVVPLAEAARSGTDWTEAQRERFANDPGVLLAVTAHSNRSKGDQDPAHWLPERHRCSYVHRWIGIKTTYRLTVDAAEARALTTVLDGCPEKGERR